MGPAAPENLLSNHGFEEERLGVVELDGARHRLIWAYDEDRSVSVLVDIPERGSATVPRLVGAFAPDEGFEVVEVLAADYETHYINRPRAERIVPRPLEPADLRPKSGLRSG